MTMTTVTIEELERLVRDGEAGCGWFALCENTATRIERAADALVPICDRCATRVEALR